MPFQIYLLTGSPALVGLVGIAQAIPLIVFSFVGVCWQIPGNDESCSRACKSAWPRSASCLRSARAGILLR